MAEQVPALLKEIERLQGEAGNLRDQLDGTRFSERVAHESAKRQIAISETLTAEWSAAVGWAALWKRRAKHHRRLERAGGRALTKALTELREVREENERLQAKLDQIRADPQGIGDVLATVGRLYEAYYAEAVSDEQVDSAVAAVMAAYDKMLG